MDSYLLGNPVPVLEDKSEERYSNSEDFWVVRIDSAGNKIWDKRYGDKIDIANDAIVDQEGNFVLFGVSELTQKMSHHWQFNSKRSGRQ